MIEGVSSVCVLIKHEKEGESGKQEKKMNKSRRRGLTFLASSGILTKLSGVRVKHQNAELQEKLEKMC